MSNNGSVKSVTTGGEAVQASLLVGTVVDFAGVTRAKGVPLRRLSTFVTSGMGASQTWPVFCVDNGVAFTPSIGVSGDLRFRIDVDKVRPIDDGVAGGPADFYNQDGSPSALCSRARLAAVVEHASERGLVPMMGTELEFVLTTLTGERLPKASWTAYGINAFVTHRAFLVDLTETLERAGVGTEQIHAEHGEDQFEVSLAPAAPVDMADGCVLTRILIGSVAERHGMAVSFSPMPWVGGSGNGAHLHLSLKRQDRPLFGGGDGPHGLTVEGGSAIAGIIGGLNELMGIYAGSVISAQRLQPGRWSGASAGWGLENREAAVRFLAATTGNPHGANVELKIVDPSANIYLAAAALLGSAVNGIDNNLPLPAELATNSAESAVALNAEQFSVLAALENSPLAARILGPDIVEGVVAVRRHEATQYADKSPAQIAEAVRFAWSA
ncbi:glutamine synthetase [Leifsonia sp. YAF41]|uniref:glutamine synthetase family protein n=1 Tax=Leifsonia sp. YAF41 TaxID=3233086 RepID=UPI003F9D2DC3